MSESAAKISKLTDAKKARISRNRDKALQIRAIKTGKLTQHPYAKGTVDDNGKQIIKIHGSKYVDSGGGFLIEEALVDDGQIPQEVKVIENDKGIEIPVVYVKCIECDKNFAESYLMNNFDYLVCDGCRDSEDKHSLITRTEAKTEYLLKDCDLDKREPILKCAIRKNPHNVRWGDMKLYLHLQVCDGCRDSEDKHSLITRTEAKTEYLLKDCDLDKREPILKCVIRKNPHNVRWGDMKLYLHLQVEQRAVEVWGSEEQLIKEREQRDEKREKSKLKKYNKNLKKLRMEVRSSLFDRTSAGPHRHVYGEESYNEEEDVYTHVCTECGFSETYEKM